ncbi:MAG: phenylalanine--tRNA ligase subunit alpha [Actinomycetota bacterium]|nr:phenylalanine--tRNA ligase subunit alpha [Actinomycetota bacterium]
MDSLATVDWTAYETEALAAIAAALGELELDEARVRYLGRKSELAQALRGVRDRESGMLLNGLRSQLESAVEEREAELKQRAYEAAADSAIDVTIPGAPVVRGRLHLLTQVRREIEDIFLGLGYEVWDGNEVATVWENFDALNTDLGHPSRSPADTFYLDQTTVLRTQTSPDQIRAMQSRTPPIYMISPGRCYRRDTPDATHSPTFLQVELLAVDKGLTLADLQGTVLHFFRALFGQEREVRMRTSEFPFTEPSVEFDVTCFICSGAGCATCKHSGWIEMGGAGWVDPQVFRNLDLDPSVWSGYAFGLGIERIAMLRHGLPDLRAFWENDLRVLRQF